MLPFLFATFVLLIGGPEFARAASPDENIQAATTAFKGGDFRQAAQFFMAAGDDLARMKNPQSVLLWGNAALALLKAEDYQAAADLYEKLLAGKNKVPAEKLQQFYFNLVFCRGKLNQAALRINAIDRMLKAVAKIPPLQLADIYAAQGDAYRSLELYGPAVAAYDKAAHILPKNATDEHRARILTALGLSQGNLGDYAAARKNLQAARSFAENAGVERAIAQADSNLGVLSWEQGEYEEAKKYLEAALEREQKNNFSDIETADQNNMGILYKATGNYQEAMKRVEKAAEIAKKLGDVRSEGHATVNRALINRIAGNHKEALADYNAAEKLFEKASFREGQGTTLLGAGRMAELQDKNYAAARQNYLEALEIFNDLNMPRWQAPALLLLGDVHKRMAEPGRSTRDLVFDEEPTLPNISKDEALQSARDYYHKSLAIAERQNLREVIWAARQGLGFMEYKAGNLEEALKHYQAAIDLVASMYASLEQVEMLGEYMAGKEDLYNEAMEVCAALYQKTGDKKYQDLMLKYSETLKNEIQKASAALVKLEFEDKNKQEMYEKLLALGKANAKAAKSAPVVNELPANASPEQKAKNALEVKALKDHQIKAQKLEGDYRKLLSEWKKKYSADSLLFDSSARVDIPEIQKNLQDGHVVLQYLLLPDQLLINVIDKDGVTMEKVEITKKAVNTLIRDKFIIDYLQNGSGDVNKTLHSLYKMLIEPVKPYLAGKSRIYTITDGYLASLPFSALVSSYDDKGRPIYLVEEMEIGSLRPSFANILTAPRTKGSVKKMLAVANPTNKNFPMSQLEGSIDEIEKANDIFKVNQNEKVIALETIGEKNKDLKQEIHDKFPLLSETPDRPTEPWFRKQLENDQQFEVLYFATHGQAQSDTFSKIVTGIQKREKENNPLTERQKKLKLMLDGNLREKTPLNGFLYLSSREEDDITKSPIDPKVDGCLTIKEIMELKGLEKTRYAILSACNAAVAMVPYSIAAGYEEEDKNREMFDPKEMEKALIDQGLLPGVDQASFVEAFMRKGVQDVFASFWPLDDTVAPIIMSSFLNKLVEQGEHPDPVAALSFGQKKFIERAKNGDFESESKNPEKIVIKNAIDPFGWAVGAIFGK